MHTVSTQNQTPVRTTIVMHICIIYYYVSLLEINLPKTLISWSNKTGHNTAVFICLCIYQSNGRETQTNMKRSFQIRYNVNHSNLSGFLSGQNESTQEHSVQTLISIVTSGDMYIGAFVCGSVMQYRYPCIRSVTRKNDRIAVSWGYESSLMCTITRNQYMAQSKHCPFFNF